MFGVQSLLNCQGAVVIGYGNVVHKNMYLVNGENTQKYVLSFAKVHDNIYIILKKYS